MLAHQAANHLVSQRIGTDGARLSAIRPRRLRKKRHAEVSARNHKVQKDRPIQPGPLGRSLNGLLSLWPVCHPTRSLNDPTWLVVSAFDPLLRAPPLRFFDDMTGDQL